MSGGNMMCRLLTRSSRVQQSLLPRSVCTTVAGRSRARKSRKQWESLSSSRNISWSGLSLQGNVTVNNVKLRTEKTKKASLVIFDKDGTLICFHSMWTPWAKKIVTKIEEATGQKGIQDKIYDVLGFCTKKQKVMPGLLAEATSGEIKDEMTKMLVGEGMAESEVRGILESVWMEGNARNPEEMKKLGDLETLFKILKKNNVKIALITSDNRKGTDALLEELGLAPYFEHVICGDDPDTEPKPAPYNALKICQKLGIDPADAVMVGDTKTDMLLGKSAKLGWSVGVLSGVGQTGDLLPHADHVVNDIEDILPLILPYEEWQSCYAYSPYERFLVEPNEKGNIVQSRKKPLADLVIFDLHGTLICLHRRYPKFVEFFCSRLKQMTGLELSEKVNRLLGLNKDATRVMHGILSEGTSSEAKGAMVEVLRREGIFYQEAIMIVNQIWKEADFILKSQPAPLCPDIEGMFQELKQNGIKIAINTGEPREFVISDLMNLGLTRYVDMLICGDDPISQPRPSAHNTLLICDELKVSPSRTAVVGDSVGDLQMGQSAFVTQKIGVLSGVNSEDQLKHYADNIIPSIANISDLILQKDKSSGKDSNQQTQGEEI